jgi:hypothetical protein
MSDRNTVIRAANTLSLAAWFGGSLMGSIGLPKTAAAAAGSRKGRVRDAIRAEGEGWSAWQPVQVGAIATQLVSGAALTVVNRQRVVGQRGVAATSMVRASLTGVAIATSVLAARSGRDLEQAVGRAPSEEDGDGGGDVASIERRTRALQVAVPVLTGALLVIDSLMGEQQRPNQVVRGTVRRVLPGAVADRLAP